MSKEDKKDVLSSSGLVLVIVRKESSKALCWAFGAPLRSRICNAKSSIRDVSRPERYWGFFHLLEVGKRGISNE